MNERKNDVRERCPSRTAVGWLAGWSDAGWQQRFPEKIRRLAADGAGRQRRGQTLTAFVALRGRSGPRFTFPWAGSARAFTWPFAVAPLSFSASRLTGRTASRRAPSVPC